LIAPRGAAVSISAPTSTSGRPLTSAGTSAIAPKPLRITLIEGVQARAPSLTNTALVAM